MLYFTVWDKICGVECWVATKFSATYYWGRASPQPDLLLVQITDPKLSCVVLCFVYIVDSDFTISFFPPIGHQIS
jgi:hypothetical protein